MRGRKPGATPPKDNRRFYMGNKRGLEPTMQAARTNVAGSPTLGQGISFDLTITLSLALMARYGAQIRAEHPEWFTDLKPLEEKDDG